MRKTECDDPIKDTREWFLITHGTWVAEGDKVKGIGSRVESWIIDPLRLIEGEVVHCLEYPDERSVIVLSEDDNLYSMYYYNIREINGELIGEA